MQRSGVLPVAWSGLEDVVPWCWISFVLMVTGLVILICPVRLRRRSDRPGVLTGRMNHIPGDSRVGHRAK